MRVIKLGKYKHYKGKEYEVIGIARQSETLQRLVVYKALDKSKDSESSLWVRPINEFTSTVEVSGQKIPRFSYLG